MTSTRLPGKVMLPILGRSILEWHVERVRRAELVDDVVVATTENASDDVICEAARQLGVGCFRGDEHNVLSRYLAAANEFDADIVVRVTSDCPLIDPCVIDQTIRAFLDAEPSVDYASNRAVQTYPRGLDTEVLSKDLLALADREADRPDDREHVTLFVWRQPERFRVKNVPCHVDLSQHRWTVDTAEDFDLVSRILGAVGGDGPGFTLEDCLRAIEMNPEWPIINAHIIQKALNAT